MRASQLADPLYEPEPFDFDAPIAMQPIRFEYQTLSDAKRIQTDMLDRLGLVYVTVRGNLFAVSECESNALRLTARELLLHDGLGEAMTSEAAVTRRAQALLVQLVLEQAQTVGRSALHTPVSLEVQRFAQEQRAIADAELLAHGVDMKARIAHAVAESEAA